MKILILGSGSFAGQALYSNLLENECDVFGINRSTLKQNYHWEWINKYKKEDLRWYELNLNENLDEFSKLIKEINPTHIIDFMGQGMVAPSWGNPKLWYSTNISEKASILETIRNLKSLEKYVRASTPEVYGSNSVFINEKHSFNPSTPYAVSHAAIDYHIRCLGREYNFPYSIGRFSNFYGEGQQLYRVIPRAILSCLTGKKFILDGKGASKRFFIHSKDIVNSIKLLLFNSDNFTEYNFSGNEEISISDLVYLICQITNVDYKEIVEFGPERAGKDMFYRLDCQKAMTELMWKPKVNLREGIEKTVEWIVRNLDKLSKENWNYIHKN